MTIKLHHYQVFSSIVFQCYHSYLFLRTYEYRNR